MNDRRVFVVQSSYDYEGDNVLYAGVDWDAAIEFADTVECCDRVTLSVWLGPVEIELFTRGRDEDGYTHKQLENGQYIEKPG